MTNSVILDMVVLIAIGIAVVRGWSHGSIREFFSLLGLVVGVALAPLLAGPLAVALAGVSGMDVNLARAIALGVVLGVPALVGAIVGVRTSRGVSPRGPARLDSIGGSMFALTRSILVASLVLYAIAAVASDTADSDGFSTAVSDSASGQMLASSDSPFAMVYDGVVNGSDELQALVLWAKQRSGFDRRIPGQRLDFAATNEGLDPAADTEKAMLRLLNLERKDRGLAALGWCEECARVARGHSKDMYRHGYFSHVDSKGDDPFDRMMDAEIAYGAAGENLSIAPTVGQAHRELMQSPDHRENILRSLFDEVGIGCFEGPYGFMCTQVFRALL